MINHKFFAVAILSLIVVFSSSSFIFAHPHPGQVLINGHTHQPQTEYIPLNGMIGIEKTSIMFHTPEENSLPWGFVEGKIASPVAGYPVIIQIFKDNGQTTKLYDGDYQVTIFKVVYLDQSNLI